MGKVFKSPARTEAFFKGAMVLGADGVHSKTRRLMRGHALGEEPRREWDAEMPYTSTYRCMWCSFPLPSVSEPGEDYETQEYDRSIIYFTGHTRAWLFAFEKLPKPTSERIVYAEEDIQAFSKRFSNLPIAKDLKVKDVFANRTTAGMADLEEGLVRHWSWKRIVLAGDSCHKFTPNAGLGFQNGIQDVVALCNRLHRELSKPGVTSLETSVLERIFNSYQRYRVAALKTDAIISDSFTRLHAWATTPYYVMARYIMAPEFWDYMMNNFVLPRIFRKRLVLDYIHTNEPYQGRISWKYPMRIEDECEQPASQPT